MLQRGRPLLRAPLRAIARPRLEQRRVFSTAVADLPPAAAAAAPAYSPWTDPAVYSAVRQPVDYAHTLPGSVYHDEGFFKVERERLFKSSWVAVAETCDLANPGDVMPATVGGASIILANDRGTIRAFHNVCRHRGAQLVSEKCSKRATILCPYHRWGYSLDGRCVGTPAFVRCARPHHERACALQAALPRAVRPSQASPRVLCGRTPTRRARRSRRSCASSSG